jgi:hypothetical protein
MAHKMFSKNNFKKIVLIGIFSLLPLVCFALETKKNIRDNMVEIKGILYSSVFFSWSPNLDPNECHALNIKSSDKTYYLVDTCSFSDSISSMVGQIVIIKGTIEKKEMDVPIKKMLNPPTKKETFLFLHLKEIKLDEDERRKATAE